MPGCAQTLYHEPSPFVDLVLYLSTALNISHEYNDLLSPGSSPNKP